MLQLKKGNRVKINGKIFTVQKKEFHKASDKDSSDTITFELGDNFILYFEWNEPNFIEVLEKKGGSTQNKRWKYINIKEIEKIE
jgi:hypothetical protein